MFYSLSFGLEEIPYTIRFSERARRARLVVDGKRVEVVSPPTRRINRLIKFAEDNRIWIYRQLQRQRATQNDVDFLPQTFADGEQVTYFGKALTVAVMREQCRYVDLRVSKATMHIKVPLRFDGEAADMAIRRGLRREAIPRLQKLADRLASRWAKEIGKAVQIVKLKRLKSRWGSCSRSGEIILNEKLIHCPFYVVRYVVWHEVCHLAHFNHSKRFWELVASRIPDYKKAQMWLKAHQASLI